MPSKNMNLNPKYLKNGLWNENEIKKWNWIAQKLKLREIKKESKNFKNLNCIIYVLFKLIIINLVVNWMDKNVTLINEAVIVLQY